MAEDRSRKSVVLSIYGVGEPGLPSTYVDAEVFSAKLNAFLRALKAADRVGGKIRKVDKPTYYISHMRTGSAIVGITEFSQPQSMYLGRSSLDTVVYVASEVAVGNIKDLGPYANLATAIHNIAKGANLNYSHIDLKRDDNSDTTTSPIVRIDDQFEYQAQRFLSASRELPKAITPPAPYVGSAQDAFDGSIKEVDLRDAVWSGKLVLTGSGVEIHCTFEDTALDDVRNYLNKRVWAEGLAIYNGKSGLPQRLEVARMRPINLSGDLRRWRGKLRPDETGGDEESDRLEQ